MRPRYSGIPFGKTVEQFDVSFQPSIDRKTKDELLTLKFIYNRENVVFLRPPRVGKTHLSVAIAIRAIESFTVYYAPAIRLVQTLKKDCDLNRLDYRLATYSKFHLMIVDEIGYLPLTKEEGNLFFPFRFVQVQTKVHNLHFKKVFLKWAEVLGEQVMASAVLDCIPSSLHYSEHKGRII